MQNEDIYCIGVMSGTSLDGLDLAYVRFNTNNYTDFDIIEVETVPYSKKWLTDLKEAIHYSDTILADLDIAYGKYIGTKIVEFIDKYAIQKIDFIASHGHTVLHQPQKGITLQIGNGQEISNITSHKVVCDFRTQDVKLGGQGAPLVPIGDKLLFANYDYCVNLGGFSNVSYQQNSERIAFDICPVNIVLNHYCRKIGLEFDDEGRIASEGKINHTLLKALNDLSFYRKSPPKSLGLEWVQSTIFPLIDDIEKDISTILRTFIEHIAVQISKVIERKNTVLFTGGGTFNSFLIERIEFLTKKRVAIPSNTLINYKEALIFGFLGLLKLKDEINCLQSVTGASKNHSSGKVFYPEK